MRLFQLIYICILLLGTLAAGAQAQVKSPPVTLEWNGYEQVLPVQSLPGKIPAFAGASIDYAERIPYYKIKLPGTQVSNFQITEAKYAPLSPEDQKLFASGAISTTPAISIINGSENKVPVSIVAIVPLRANPQSGQLEKLTSFSYTYTPQTNATQSILARTSTPGTSSVLGTGNWYKLGITNTGIHKIDKATLQALGISTQGLNPRTIQVYGNGGGMLPQSNSIPRVDDLAENAVWVSGEADGRFDDNDYVLFYAQGPHTWEYDATQSQFRHNYNVYSDTAYYFLRVGFAPGARVSSRGQTSGAAQTISSYDERLFHERDLQKGQVKSGREWYGEDFSSFTTSRDFTFAVTDIVPSSDVKLTAFLMANAAATTSFSLKLNGQTLGSQTIPSRGTYNYHPQGVDNVHTYSINQQRLGPSSELKVNIAFNQGGSSTSLGFLNYLEFNLQRQLKLYGEQTGFRSIASMAAPISRFQIAAPSTAQVWDVTDPLRPTIQETIVAGANIAFSARTDQLREFIVFRSGTGLMPTAVGKVTNQNLHSLNLNGNLDFVIVTHPKFLQEANRLANHRRQHSNMQTAVVTTTQVYNEFSSGAQDVTAIRDFMRMLHSRSNKSADNVMYLLLFGDASYDFKNRIANNTNFVPAYQSRQSLHPITSYSSEDYYGFLDDNEGEWEENNLGDHFLDIGIGRLPVKTPTEAATVVDKIIAYDSPNHFGKWRSRVTFVSDDGDANEHQNDAEFLANYLETEHINYNPNKIYLDLYPQIVVANGQRSPKATAAVEKAVEQGSLIINYTGHGNEEKWADEELLTTPQIKNWRNKDNLTFMLTATCEFGRYDDPGYVSGAEAAILQPQGGAVGLLTTTRPVYSNGNRVLNRNFFQSAFTPINGHMPYLGDLVQRTKNNSITDNASGSRGVNNRNFTLLADPSMQLAYPQYQANITHINAKEVSIDTLSALGKVSIRGHIASAAGAVENSFNGNVRLTVYEKPVNLTTFGDEQAQQVPVQLRENIVYDGQASVKNGLFELSFVVPKDIAYNYGNGKFSLYAHSSTHDAIGASKSIIIGGTARNVVADNTPPTISLYMNDESFVFGGNTGKNPTLLAKFFDDNGINTAGLGIGHEITAVLDNNRDNLIILNDYYTSDVDSYQSGRVRFAFKDLDEGPHSIKIKAWDTHNNSAEEYIEFFVSNDAKIALKHVLNHPNPFSTKTTFHFDHNRAGEDLDIQIQIFTISGKLIKTLETTSFSSKTHLAEISWDGRDEYNDVVARGVYIYKVNVRSQQDGAKVSNFEKLVILN